MQITQIYTVLDEYIDGTEATFIWVRATRIWIRFCLREMGVADKTSVVHRYDSRTEQNESPERPLAPL
jgi:hypothetical protein